MFLVLLLFATQVLLNLYATSVVSAATFDAARSVAAAGGSDAARGTADEQLRKTLGRFYDRAHFDWSIEDDVVVLHVHADDHHFFYRGWPLDPVETIDRTVRVRVECFRTALGGCRR